MKLTVPPQSKTRSEVSLASYSPFRAEQHMASVLLFLPGDPTCMRRPKRRKCPYMALVAASRPSREERGKAASPAYNDAQKLNRIRLCLSNQCSKHAHHFCPLSSCWSDTSASHLLAWPSPGTPSRLACRIGRVSGSEDTLASRQQYAF